MPSSKTEIANLALTHLGVGYEIADLDTEVSKEASAIRAVYQTSLHQMLREFPWPFATVIAELSQVSLADTPPNDEWNYSYRYPPDCLEARRIFTGNRVETNETRVPYRITRDGSGLLILTDQADACLEYTSTYDEVVRFPPDFSMALSFLVAMYAAPRLTAGDPFKLSDRSAKMYEFHMNNAKANAANEEQPDQPPESEFIRARS